jgi:hypothetical protein
MELVESAKKVIGTTYPELWTNDELKPDVIKKIQKLNS